ncbi:MAG: glutamate racemase [Candidatus Limnocylindria bacterium]
MRGPAIAFNATHRRHDSRSIGVFDSGVGGLTVLSELQRRLPAESTIYLGDNARAPYGPRPAEEVRRFTLESIRWLLDEDVKLLVIACNTATASALDAVRAATDTPVVGVIRPGATAAAAATRVASVGIIATVGTVASGAYTTAINAADPTIRVTQQACPDLVPLVEAGVTDGPSAEAVVRAYLDQLRGAAPDLDTVLLGCTHYPLLRSVIERVLGTGVRVVGSAFTTALAVEDLLDALGARGSAADAPRHRVLTTGDVEAFRAIAGRIFGASVPGIEPVRLPATAVG